MAFVEGGGRGLKGFAVGTAEAIVETIKLPYTMVTETIPNGIEGWGMLINNKGATSELGDLLGKSVDAYVESWKSEEGAGRNIGHLFVMAETGPVVSATAPKLAQAITTVRLTKTIASAERAISKVKVGMELGADDIAALRAGRLAAIGRRLQEHVTRAAQFIDKAPDDLLRTLSPLEGAQFRRGELLAALRGKAVERVARRLIEKDTELMEFVMMGKVNRGPDLILKGGGKWWDITTPENWPRHLDRPSRLGYVGEGSPLLTR